MPVAGTPFDFTKPHTIGERLSQVENGYDHNYVSVLVWVDFNILCLVWPLAAAALQGWPMQQSASSSVRDGQLEADGVD